MKKRIIDCYVLLSQRPLSVLGLILGLAICGILFLQNRDIRERVIHIEANTPCLNLSAHSCADKLLHSLKPAERRHAIAKDFSHLDDRLRLREERLKRKIQHFRDSGPSNNDTPKSKGAATGGSSSSNGGSNGNSNSSGTGAPSHSDSGSIVTPGSSGVTGGGSSGGSPSDGSVPGGSSGGATGGSGGSSSSTGGSSGGQGSTTLVGGTTVSLSTVTVPNVVGGVHVSSVHVPVVTCIKTLVTRC